MKYLVIEIQNWENGSVSTPAYAYDNENSANAKYHQILSAASTSELPLHAALMCTSDGFFMKSEHFTHSTNA